MKLFASRLYDLTGLAKVPIRVFLSLTDAFAAIAGVSDNLTGNASAIPHAINFRLVSSPGQKRIWSENTI